MDHLSNADGTRKALHLYLPLEHLLKHVANQQRALLVEAPRFSQGLPERELLDPNRRLSGAEAKAVRLRPIARIRQFRLHGQRQAFSIAKHVQSGRLTFLVREVFEQRWNRSNPQTIAGDDLVARLQSCAVGWTTSDRGVYLQRILLHP